MAAPGMAQHADLAPAAAQAVASGQVLVEAPAMELQAHPDQALAAAARAAALATVQPVQTLDPVWVEVWVVRAAAAVLAVAWVVQAAAAVLAVAWGAAAEWEALPVAELAEVVAGGRSITMGEARLALA
ncbi:hypothetical protein [Pelotalea chapellei]|uniref:Uncharacterized protein n=1 Tax=Pelotalea chapellei TaxID=44671 RepID=A0ABS5U6W1_9BACT|nr:hypothetical protein [Pelotalea chapellei]MBT1071402.1 hypothetical protein [Pelotalea chapellei]